MSADARDIAVDAADIWPGYTPTQLIESPELARAARVRRVLVKLECERPMGNFKALGGMVAGVRALARAAGVSRIAELRAPLEGSAARSPVEPGAARDRQRQVGGRRLPRLVCASAGNHGLAVAAAARWAGTAATIYLAGSVNRARAVRIEAQGARLVWTPGTYDDAVEQASRADGLVIADTSPNANDPVVRDVMDGYGLISRELTAQLGKDSTDVPTHLFVQAGVGGLAAAMADGLRDLMLAPSRVLVVEPQSAACVTQALLARRPVRIPGELRTDAEMLACGLASTPALKTLEQHGAGSVLVDNELLQDAAQRFRDVEGIRTTASGAAGLAGLLHVSAAKNLRDFCQLDEESCVLLIVTEGPVLSASTIFGTS